MISAEARTKLRRLMELRQDRDEKDRAAKLAKAAYQEIEDEVFMMFKGQEEDADDFDIDAEAEGVKGTVKVPLGEPWGTVAFRTRETPHARILDEEKLLEYFEKRAMVDEISAPKFAKARLNEIVRDALEQGLDLPPGLDYYTNRGMTVTRQKG